MMDAVLEKSYKLGMDQVRRLIKETAIDRGRSLAWLSRQIGRSDSYLYDFIAKGSPRVLPEEERKILADRLGLSEDYLRAGKQDAPNTGRPAMAEGERINLESVRDSRLREALQRELKAVKRGEVWQLTTSLIEAKYPPGTIVVIDTSATPYENDYVLAEVWTGREKTTIFRKYIPPNIVTATVNVPGVRGHIVDRESVVIRGVIRVGLR